MPTLRDDIADALDEASGRRPEHEVAAEATWARLQSDPKFARALRNLLPKSGKPAVKDSDDE